MMTLDNLQLLDLQPLFLQDDPSTQAICHALQPIFRIMLKMVEAQQIYTAVDRLGDKQLDEIAWGLDCIWYNPSDTLPAKRQNIKSALTVFAKMGTAAAIKNAVAANFGKAAVEEWFSYGGVPGNFKIIIEDPAATDSRAAEFSRIVNEVKGARNVLEKIVLMTTSPTPMRIGATSIITHRISSRENLPDVGGISQLSVCIGAVSYITFKIRSVENG